jgi:DNA-binding protein YbaB
MAREIDETWIDEAIERYGKIEARLAAFDQAISGVEVTVRSRDGTVEVLVTADGTIRDVRILGSLTGRGNGEVSRSVREAVVAAAEAAAWARRKLHAETFADYPGLG